jgi:predicted RNase H-like HicB family nuclease
MIKDKDYYMSIDYDIIVDQIDELDGGGYLAYYKDIRGVMGDGSTKEEAIKDVKDAFEVFVEVSIKHKDPIPEPVELDKSKRINITMTNRRINRLDSLAKQYHVSRSRILSELTDRLLNGEISIPTLKAF